MGSASVLNSLPILIFLHLGKGKKITPQYLFCVSISVKSFEDLTDLPHIETPAKVETRAITVLEWVFANGQLAKFCS